MASIHNGLEQSVSTLGKRGSGVAVDDVRSIFMNSRRVTKLASLFIIGAVMCVAITSTAVGQTVPLSTTMAESVRHLRSWAASRARRASSVEGEAM